MILQYIATNLIRARRRGKMESYSWEIATVHCACSLVVCKKIVVVSGVKSESYFMQSLLIGIVYVYITWTGQYSSLLQCYYCAFLCIQTLFIYWRKSEDWADLTSKPSVLKADMSIKSCLSWLVLRALISQFLTSKTSTKCTQKVHRGELINDMFSTRMSRAPRISNSLGRSAPLTRYPMKGMPHQYLPWKLNPSSIFTVRITTKTPIKVSTCVCQKVSFHMKLLGSTFSERLDFRIWNL